MERKVVLIAQCYCISIVLQYTVSPVDQFDTVYEIKKAIKQRKWIQIHHNPYNTVAGIQSSISVCQIHVLNPNKNLKIMLKNYLLWSHLYIIYILFHIIYTFKGIVFIFVVSKTVLYRTVIKRHVCIFIQISHLLCLALACLLSLIYRRKQYSKMVLVK